MTDNEIIKALECCGNMTSCSECPLYSLGGVDRCMHTLLLNALDFTYRQKAEIERLKKAYEYLEKHILEIQNETLRVFAERLKEQLNNIARVKIDDYDYFCISLDFIDNLVKEMAGEGG